MPILIRMAMIDDNQSPLPGTGIQPRASSLPLLALGLVWLGLAVTGTALMFVRAGAPGDPGSPGSDWPRSSTVPRDPQRPTLVVFIHPHCPCSRASIGELAVLMARCQERVSVRAIFLKPAGTPPNWAITDTWRSAAAIPGVTVSTDPDGVEARRFGAATSGETLLYDTGGRLVFHGGITAARGHSGDNAGRGVLQAMLFGRPPARTTTPVFGCPLFGSPPLKSS